MEPMTPDESIYSTKYQPFTYAQNKLPYVPVEEEDHLPNTTDAFFANIFKISACLYLLLFFMAASTGKLAHLTSFPNFDGKYCGVDDPVRGLPHIYYPLNPSISHPVLMMDDGQCVVSCPGVEDVGKPIAVTLTQFEEDPVKPGQSALVIKYTVHSPQYASQVYAGGLCLPMEKNLKANFIQSISTTSAQIKAALGTIGNAWPVILRDTVLGIVIIMITGHIALPSVPRLTLYILSITTILAPFCFGIVAMWWSLGEALPSHFGEMYSLSVSSSLLIGMMFLCFAINQALTVSMNWAVLWEGVSAYKSLRGVLHDLGRTHLVSIILILFSYLTTTAGLLSISYVASQTVFERVSEFGDVNNNEAYPVHLHVESFSFRSVFVIFIMLLVIYMVITLFNTISRWCGAYVAVVWYYSAPLQCGCDQRDVPAIEALRAIHGAMTLSLGSNVLYTLFSPLFKYVVHTFNFLSRRKCPNFTPPDGDHLSDAYVSNTPGEISEFARWVAQTFVFATPTFAAVNEFYHNGCLTENILSGSDLLPSMGNSRRRMVQRNNLSYPPSAGRYVGSFNNITSFIAYSSASFCGLVSFVSLSSRYGYDVALKTDYKSLLYSVPESPYFVCNPAFTSLLIFCLIFNACEIIMGFIEGIVDSIFYCYICDLQSEGENEQRMEEHPVVVDRCPAGVKVLLMKLLSDELGLVFDCNEVVNEFEDSPNGPNAHLMNKMYRNSFDVYG